MDDSKSPTFGTRLRAVGLQVAGAMGRLLGEVRSRDPEIKKYRENALVRSRDPEIKRHREDALAKLEGTEKRKAVRADTSMSSLDSLSRLLSTPNASPQLSGARAAGIDRRDTVSTSLHGASLESGGIEARERASPRSEASWAIPSGPSVRSMESLSSIPTSSTSSQPWSGRADGIDRRGSVYTASSSDPDKDPVYRDSHIGAPEQQQLPDGKKSHWSHSTVSSDLSVRSARSSLHGASLEGGGKTSAELGARAGGFDRDTVFTAFSQDTDDGSLYRDSHGIDRRESVSTAFSQDADEGSVYRDSRVGAREQQQLPDEMRSRRSAGTVSNGLTVRGDRSSLHVTSELDGRSADLGNDQPSRVSSREGDRLDDSIEVARSVKIVRAKPIAIELKTPRYDERSRAPRGR